MNSAAGETDRPDHASANTRDAQLRLIYDEVDAEVTQAGPHCALSGRCCRFQEFGHTLFVSELEFHYLVRHAPPTVRPLDSGETCPWQDGSGRCQAREARPLGCRVYFCDPAYEPVAPVLSERFIARLKTLADSHSVEWNYAPLHYHLHKSAISVEREGPEL